MLVALVIVAAAVTRPAATGDASGSYEVVVRQIPRPVQLAFTGGGTLVVLSHGWRGDAAAEIFRVTIDGRVPVDATAAPRLVVPFVDGPHKSVFGSLAADPVSGELFLGEENGNRVYRLGPDHQLHAVAIGFYHLVGGSGLALDGRALVMLDYTNAVTALRAEAPPPREFDWLAGDAYEGPLVFRIGVDDATAWPRRVDLLTPLFPRTRGRAPTPLPWLISVAVTGPGELALLSSLGELFRLTPQGDLRTIARLPSGHYHRTNLAVAPDGSIFVSSGFHIREVFRVSPAGAVTSVARGLADPAGIAVDSSGAVYVAETARHRIIRLTPRAALELPGRPGAHDPSSMAAVRPRT